MQILICVFIPKLDIYLHSFNMHLLKLHINICMYACILMSFYACVQAPYVIFTFYLSYLPHFTSFWWSSGWFTYMYNETSLEIWNNSFGPNQSTLLQLSICFTNQWKDQRFRRARRFPGFPDVLLVTSHAKQADQYEQERWMCGPFLHLLVGPIWLSLGRLMDGSDNLSTDKMLL